MQTQTNNKNGEHTYEQEQVNQNEQQANQLRLALFVVSWMMGLLFVISNVTQ